MSTVSVRYIVDDVAAAVDFYTTRLGFSVQMQPAPGFAALTRGDLRLLLNAPGAGGAGKAAPEARPPEPGGWNRFQIEVDDLSATVARLEAQGVSFRSAVVTGKGGNQAVIEDSCGNPIELFQPTDE